MPIIKTVGENKNFNIFNELRSHINTNATDPMTLFQEIMSVLGYNDTDAITIDLGDWSVSQGSYCSYSLGFYDDENNSNRNTMDFNFFYHTVETVKQVVVAKTSNNIKTAKSYNITLDEEKNISLTPTSSKWTNKPSKWNSNTNWERMFLYKTNRRIELFKNGENEETFLLELSDISVTDIQDNFDLPFFQIPSGLPLVEQLEMIYQTKPLTCNNFSFTRGYHLPPYSGVSIPFDKITIADEQIKELLVTTDDYQLNIVGSNQILKKRNRSYPYGMEDEKMEYVNAKSFEEQKFIEEQQASIGRRIK